jgi:sterol desaturase/sphingolipid hydroxylase (fatty acid hydroxylase superfamily)
MSDLLGAFVVRIATITFAFLIGFLLEEITHRGRRLPTSVVANLGHTLVNVVGTFLLRLVILDSIFRLAASLPGAGLIRPPVGSPLTIVLTAVGWLMLHDLLYYGFHRWQHTSRWLWAEHELHHADEAMNVTTNLRHHWLEAPLHAMCVTLPLGYLVQLPVPFVLPLAVTLDTFGYLLHLDTRVRFGSMNQWLANPEFHRVHHSAAPEHRDQNFAAIFPIWDRLFGTYYQPSNSRPQTGVHSGVRIGPLQGVLWPFMRWRAMLRGNPGGYR